MITQKHELYGVEKHMSAIIVENLTFSYPGSYDNIFENTSFQLDTSWKLGLVGRNGRGKTTLCKLLMNQYEYTGKIICNEKFVYLNRFNLSNHLVRLITDSLHFKGLNNRIEACDFSVKQKIQASFSF